MWRMEIERLPGRSVMCKGEHQVRFGQIYGLLSEGQLQITS
jgi:hypothetical protein